MEVLQLGETEKYRIPLCQNWSGRNMVGLTILQFSCVGFLFSSLISYPLFRTESRATCAVYYE